VNQQGSDVTEGEGRGNLDPRRDYRHHNKSKAMKLAADEFIRRFLLHALPDGFHRIRHYGFLANRHRADKLALCRRLLAAPAPIADDNDSSDSARNPGLPVSCARRCRSRRGVKACAGCSSAVVARRFTSSEVPPSRGRVEQVGSSFPLRVVGVLELDPPDAGLVGVGKALRDNAFEVMDAHQMKELSPSPLD
jgi:Putative transposase